MDNAWLTGIMIIFIIYYLSRAYSSTRRKKSYNNMITNDILDNDDYKVKGQWDR